jgi:hypothetical protein
MSCLAAGLDPSWTAADTSASLEGGKGIMKNGLWIGGLVLALFARGSDLIAEDGKWRPVDSAPDTEASGVSLDRPVALQARPVSGAMPSAVVPTGETPVPSSGLVPASYETPARSAARSAVRPATEKPPSHPAPEIIAVSAPAQPLPPPTPPDEEEQTESLFAIDRPLRSITARRRAPGGTVVQAAATSTVPMAPTAPSALPMVPGFGAPVDTSWLPSGETSWIAGQPNLFGVDEGDGAAGPGFRPLGNRFYVGGEYLLWWLQGQQTPVLATTSSPADSGILGAPSTQVLFGGNGINSGPFSGGRFWAGYWLNCKTALEVNGFFLGQRSANFSTNTSMNPVIARPFLEANNGQEFAQLTSLPGVTSGTLSINAPTNLWGLGGNLRCLLCCGCNYNIYALLGFRNVNLDEKLNIEEDIQGLATAPQPFTNQTITVNDSFATQNHFYGGNIGLGGFWYWGRWSINANTQVALGDTVQMLDINGSQRFVSPTGQVQNFTGGLLALPSNIGHFSNNAFSVVPEVGVNLGYNFTPGLRAFVGYNFLYWSNVIRPGTSIDRSLDVTQIPNFPLNPEPAPVPGQHPAPVFHEVGFWAQGISFGLQYVY